MKTHHFRFTQIAVVSVLIGCFLIGWAAAGMASEKWDARTTDRVNLRKNPNSTSSILSIVPENHPLRILEQNGSWYKVDVAGKIHGKGWLYAEYVEKVNAEPEKKELAVEDPGLRPEPKESQTGSDHPEPPVPSVLNALAAEPPKAVFTENVSTLGLEYRADTRNSEAHPKIDENIRAAAKISANGIAPKFDFSELLAPEKTESGGARPWAMSRLDKVPALSSIPVAAGSPGVAVQKPPTPPGRFLDSLNMPKASLTDTLSSSFQPDFEAFSDPPPVGAHSTERLAAVKSIPKGVAAENTMAVPQNFPRRKATTSFTTPGDILPPPAQMAGFENRAAAGFGVKAAAAAARPSPVIPVGPWSTIKKALRFLSISLSCVVLMLLYRENKTLSG